MRFAIFRVFVSTSKWQVSGAAKHQRHADRLQSASAVRSTLRFPFAEKSILQGESHVTVYRFSIYGSHSSAPPLLQIRGRPASHRLPAGDRLSDHLDEGPWMEARLPFDARVLF